MIYPSFKYQIEKKKQIEIHTACMTVLVGVVKYKFHTREWLKYHYQGVEILYSAKFKSSLCHRVWQKVDHWS